jgi:hypothetical protein
MGTTCTTCCTTKDEEKQEIVDNVQKCVPNKSSSKTLRPVKGKASFSDRDTQMLIRVQALVRRFLQRRKYKVALLQHDTSSKYFRALEAHETITNQKFDENKPLQTRKHTYATGAVYQGQWKGGLRHGQGTMIWPDNARYEGEWHLNAAHG